MRAPVCAVAVTCVRNPPCSPFCLGVVPPPPPEVKLCCFRSCDWRSENIAAAPVEVVEELIARHLLRDHEEELRALGRLAEEGELL